MCGSMADIQSATAEIRRGKKEKFAGVPQTRQKISANSRQKFTILWGHVEKVLLFNKFFRLSIHALAAKIQPDKVA